MKMKRPVFVIITLLTVFLFVQAASAQFPKLPKITIPKPQPTAETPQPPPSDGAESGTKSVTTGSAPRSGGPYAVKPEPPPEPQFLADTLEIGVERWEYHWKIPNDNHNTSWAPRIRFLVLYGGSSKQRFKAEYTMPDGSPWFSEALEWRGGFNISEGTSLASSVSDGERDKKAIVTAGLFGIKITNIRDGSTMFQGKFKVVRYKPQYSDVRYKNEVDYYVDYDWKLPIGIADVDFSREVASPGVRMWFKGDLKVDNLEAHLFYNGQQIASTDDTGGGVSSERDYYAWKRGDDKSLFWREFRFSWPKLAEFIVEEEMRSFTMYKNTKIINQMPGEYTVKIYFDGEQVRETKFSIANGNFADNGIAKQSNLTTDGVLLPVKVMGTLDKWNPANAKTMGFFGNPVTGIY